VVHPVKRGGIDHDRRAVSRHPGHDRIGVRHVDVLVAEAHVIHTLRRRGSEQVRAELSRGAEDEQPLRRRHRDARRA